MLEVIANSPLANSVVVDVITFLGQLVNGLANSV